MNYNGIIIGAVSFIVIALFHPLVIKSHYYFTEKIWPAYLVAGLGFLAASFFVKNVILSGAFAVIGFACLWSIKELKEQTERVEKGWSPQNPKHAKKTEDENPVETEEETKETK